MIYNILNGDSLAYSFPDTKIEGDVIVVREGLIDRDLSGVLRSRRVFGQTRSGIRGILKVMTETNCSGIKSTGQEPELVILNTSIVYRSD